MAKTPFKMRSGNATPFKMMGSSPVKQWDPTKRQDITKAAKVFTDKQHVESLKKTAKHNARVRAFKQGAKTTVKSTAKKFLTKALSFIGGKSLGVLGMLGATSSTADQPTFPKGSKHYQDPKKKIKFGE